jgi:hypothetical protein
MRRVERPAPGRHGRRHRQRGAVPAEGVKPADSARLDRLEAAARTLAVGLAGSLERELGATPTTRSLASPPA